MNYEEIIERLLTEKHITVKEAIYLLKQCEPKFTSYTYTPISIPDPITQPWTTYCTKTSNPCDTCAYNNCSFIGESPCQHCDKPNRNPYNTTISAISAIYN